MAWNFSNEIHALSGFDGEGSGVVDGIATGETFQVHAAQWLTDGAKQVISQLPSKLKEKCMTETTITNSPSYLADLDDIGEILHVTRLSADSGGYRVPCRKVASMYGEMTGDSTNIMYHASATDPAYWITSSSDAVILNVNPTPTANQTGIVYHIAYPTVAYNATSIANFPDEAEHLVVLYAAIKATEYMMLSEEDQEVYAPQLTILKQDYQQGLASFRGGGSPQGGAK